MAYGTATLTGFYQTFDGQHAEGVVEIIPNSRSLVDAEGDVILAGRVKVTLTDGAFTATLPATDDTSVEPATGRQYTVVAKLRHTHLPAVTGVELATGATVNVADIAALPVVDPEVTLALTASAAATSYVGVVTPEAHGAPATYSTATDDTTAVQAALTEVAGTGKVLFLRRMYNVPNGGLTATGSVTIRGIGGMPLGDPADTLTPLAKSGLRVNHATAAALTLTDAPGSLLEDFAVINDRTTAPTAGCGIKFAGEGSTSQSNVNRVTVLKFYDGIETSGVFWTMNQCRIYDAVRYGLYLNNSGTEYGDHGDLGVFNSVFAQNYSTWQCGSALRWRSGGGLRIIGNKFLGGVPVGNSSALHFDYCVDLMAKDGVGTGDVTLTGNSISNMSIAAIQVGLENSGGTPGGFINVAVVGNLINVGYSSAKAMLLGSPTPGLVNNIRCVHVADNIIDNMPGGGIYAFNMQALTVGVNTWQNMPAALPLVSLADSPDDGTGMRNVEVARQNNDGTTGDYVKDMRRLSTQGRSGEVVHEFTANWYNNGNGVWQTIGYVDMLAVNGGSAELELLLTGYDFSVGPIFARYRRILTKGEGSGTVTVATDGTDTTAGAGTHYAVQFVTTTANRVIIQVQNTTGGLTDWGRVHVKARGDISLMHRGA